MEELALLARSLVIHKLLAQGTVCNDFKWHSDRKVKDINKRRSRKGCASEKRRGVNVPNQVSKYVTVLLQRTGHNKLM